MKLEKISPAFLQFISGVTASVSINIITSIATDPNSESVRLFFVASPWAVVAALFFWAGSSLEYARREADLMITKNLTPNERLEIYSDAINPIRFRAKICLIAAVVFIILGFLLLLLLFNANSGTIITKIGCLYNQSV